MGSACAHPAAQSRTCTVTRAVHLCTLRTSRPTALCKQGASHQQPSLLWSPHCRRDALAAARMLNRTLVLPTSWCWCDYDWVREWLPSCSWFQCLQAVCCFGATGSGCCVAGCLICLCTTTTWNHKVGLLRVSECTSASSHALHAATCTAVLPSVRAHLCCLVAPALADTACFRALQDPVRLGGS